MPEEELNQTHCFIKEKPKKERKTLNPQTKELIVNVVKFMQLEANGQFIIPPKKVQCRAAVATGFSERTVRRVIKESKSLPVVVTPAGEKKSPIFPSKKPPNRSKPKTGLDDLTRALVRKIIHRFYVNEKTVPTVKKIYQKLVEEISFKGSTRSAHQIIKEIGFIWKKTKSKSFILVEKHEVRLKRTEYIKSIIKYREEGRPIIYLGNAVITCNLSQTRKKKEVGNKLLLMHAGGEEGLVPNASKVFQIGTKSDYHNDLIEQYLNWFKDTLLPCFSPETIIVIDASFYQNIQKQKVPTLNGNADDMKKWLSSKNIDFQEDMLIPELHQIIKKHAPKFKKGAGVFEKLLNDQGHFILRLPASHSDLNPVDVILAEIKSQLVNINVTDINNLLILCQDRLNNLTGDAWLSVCNSVKNLELQYLENESIIDSEIEKILAKSAVDNTINNKNTFIDELDCEYDLNVMKNLMNGFLGFCNN